MTPVRRIVLWLMSTLTVLVLTVYFLYDLPRIRRLIYRMDNGAGFWRFDRAIGNCPWSTEEAP